MEEIAFKISCENVVFWFFVPFAPFPELTAECLGQERVLSHNLYLAFRVRVIVCGEYDLLFYNTLNFYNSSHASSQCLISHTTIT